MACTIFTITAGNGSVHEQFGLLFDLLRQHRCLLVFDNLESILEAGRAGHYRPATKPMASFSNE
jgi:hypothetical protein